MMLAAVLLAVSCQRSPVPIRTMQQIYSDMMIADANIENSPDLHMATDSMAVYPAIFEKYGYTYEQFEEAQRYLLAHPKKFLKIVEKQKADWDKLLASVQREIEIRDSIANIEYEREMAAQAAIDNFLDSISFACLLDTVFVDLGQDSVVVTLYDDDSTRFVVPFIRDTTVVADTIAVLPRKRLVRERDTANVRRSIFSIFKKSRNNADTLTVEEPEE